MYIKHVIFQSTRPSRASTQLLQPISQFQKISIHKALAGLDQKLSGRHLAKCLFQSTSPSRASTCCAVWHDNTGLNFNPQGPRGPRRQRHHLPFACTLFQSTRPSRASTPLYICKSSRWHFNPQGPRGHRRILFAPDRYLVTISIHKALAGLDSPVSFQPLPAGDFNPQGPRGPRPTVNLFIPLPPSISIHKALAGLDEN